MTLRAQTNLLKPIAGAIDLDSVSDADFLAKGEQAGLATDTLSNVSNGDFLAKAQAAGLATDAELVGKADANLSNVSNVDFLTKAEAAGVATDAELATKADVDLSNVAVADFFQKAEDADVIVEVNAAAHGIAPAETAANNATRLNSLISTLSTAGGGVIALATPGAHQINATITWKRNVGIVCLPGAYLQWTGANAGPCIETDPADVVTGICGRVEVDEGASLTGEVFRFHSFFQIGGALGLELLGRGTATASTFLHISADSTAGETAVTKRNCAFGVFTRIFHRGTCGTLMKCSGVAVGYDGSAQVVTLNDFQNVGGHDQRVRGIDLVNHTDNNTWSGFTRLGVSGDNSVGVEINSGTPTTDVGVYNNLFHNLAVDTFAVRVGRVGLKINASKTTVVQLYHQDPIAEGGSLVIGTGAAEPYSYYVLMKEDGTGRLVERQSGYIARSQSFETTDAAITLTDDTATSIRLTNLAGADEVAVLVINGTLPTVTGVVWAKVDAGGAASSKLAGDATFFIVTTGVLSGTTGTDGRFTVSAANDGRVYFENRLGSTVRFKVTMLGAQVN